MINHIAKQKPLTANPGGAFFLNDRQYGDEIRDEEKLAAAKWNAIAQHNNLQPCKSKRRWRRWRAIAYGGASPIALT
jgi:hypothetical protein